MGIETLRTSSYIHRLGYMAERIVLESVDDAEECASDGIDSDCRLVLIMFIIALSTEQPSSERHDVKYQLENPSSRLVFASAAPRLIEIEVSRFGSTSDLCRNQ